MPRREVLKLTPELVARALREITDTTLPDYILPRTEEDHLADVEPVLASRPPCAEFWVFAYGSLLWNPAVDHVEERSAVASGWHRAFCMQIRAHRGTADRPGLMMALDRGGRCRGVALRLSSADLEAQLYRLVRREMPFKRANGIPNHLGRWITVQTENRVIPAFTYVINRASPVYVGHMTLAEIADVLADACGTGGSCAEYLYNTVNQLEARGIRDGNLWQLQALVAERLSERRFPPVEHGGPAVAQGVAGTAGHPLTTP